MAETCANCHCELGLQTEDKEFPMRVADDGGEGGGKVESFCARCFCYHRAPAEPHRFQPFRRHIGPGGWRPVKCGWPNCGAISASNDGTCMNCKSRVVIALPPRPDAGVAGWNPDQLKTAGLIAPKMS